MSDPVVRLPQREPLPAADNPRTLTRVLEHIARGVRRARPLAELLECDVRAIHEHLYAGEWLQLLERDGSLRLTKLGLELVYSGRAGRQRVWSEAVWGNQEVQALMEGRSSPPDIASLEARLRALSPRRDEDELTAHAAALERLLTPALSRPRPAVVHEQLGLGLPPSQPAVEQLPPGFSEVPGRPSPEVYLLLLRQLLDHGELSPGQIRALLDRAGGRACPVGDYIDMALRRGDAVRLQERLVITWGATERAAATDTVAGIALTDPGYRSYLSAALLAVEGEPLPPRHEERRRRYSGWDVRVFGGALEPEELTEALDRLLLGRPLDSFPLAGPAGPALSSGARSFLDRFDEDDLAIAAPSSLLMTRGKARTVNALLAASAVSPPSPADPRIRVHGGLAAPGGPPLRSIPDTMTLRLLLLSRAPWPAMFTALLLAHRREGARLAIRLESGAPRLYRGRDVLGDPVEVIDRYARSRGWLVARQFRGGVDGAGLAEVLEALGIAARLRRLLVLSDRFFARLQHEAEDREVYDQLRGVEDAMVAYIDALELDG